MTPERIKELTQKRKILADDPRSAGLVQQIDQLLRSVAKATPEVSTRKSRRAPADKQEFETISEIARIPSGEKNELRVMVTRHRDGGAKRVDLRQWYVPAGGTEYAPTRRGLSIGAEQYQAVLVAMQGALSFLGRSSTEL